MRDLQAHLRIGGDIYGVFSVDWLTLYCLSGLFYMADGWDFRKRPVASRQFSQVYDVFRSDTNEHYFTIERAPYSSIIHHSALMLKISNRLLYQSGWQNEVVDFTFQCRIDIVSVSRVDMCVDFQHFNKKMGPDTLIRRFLSGVYLKNGRGKYTLQGEQKFRHKITYLRFGGHDAVVCVYLYNKSLEMKEVKEKHHIRTLWALCGLNNGRDVWRLEVSVHPSRIRWFDKAYGEISKLTFGTFFYYSELRTMYRALIDQYFCFKVNDGTRNKTRMKNVELFMANSCLSRFIDYSSVKDSSRSDVVFVYRLLNYADLYLDKSDELPSYVCRALEDVLTSRALIGKAVRKAAMLGLEFDYSYVGDMLVINRVIKKNK